jgi:diaminohydroxyphosphoribosylaminopyrimidine deaminase / 5-amino-6-(5-phosphoribosylamino)uracil reductase
VWAKKSTICFPSSLTSLSSLCSISQARPVTAGYMHAALQLAEQGRGRTSPNPAVGAVLVRGGDVVGRGFHTWAGVDHAEIVALRQAGDAARGAILYITLEPCSHHGRTRPCADALIEAGVARVVAAMQDPNPLVSGKGFERLRAAGVEVILDEEHAAEAERLNEPFVHFMRTGLPLVTIKAALTLDGKIAAPQDNLGWITSEIARADVQKVRHFSDAILTGLGTVLQDDCLLTDRSGLERSRPLLRIVLDSQLRIPLQSKMITSAKDDVLVVGTSAAPKERQTALERAGARVLIADGPGGRTDPRKVVEHLAKELYLSLMIEAGSKVNWTMLDSQIADKVLFYYAPKILGGMKSLPVAGGQGRQRRIDAILLKRLTVHPVSKDEFAVEAYIVKS